MADTTKTLATLHTPAGRGPIAVIALAGPEAERIISEVFKPLRGHLAGGEGVIQLGHLVEGDTVIDEAMVTRRGSVLEVNIHAGPAATRKALQRLEACGAEITSPAGGPECFATAHPRWNNPAIGREMLQALPLAQSPLAVTSISRQWSAGLSKLVRSKPTARQLRQAASSLATASRVIHPAEVVLAGPPNVGKSTLANALVGRTVSIVHDQPGTTRDWVREVALLDGVPVWLTDTAGLWQASSEVEAEAVRRARKRIEEADLVLLLAAEAPHEVPNWLPADRLLRVAAKCDIGPAWLTDPAQLDLDHVKPDVKLSAKTGWGLDELKSLILQRLGLASFDPSSPMVFTARQANLLQAAAQAMDESDAQAAQHALHELLEG